MKIKAILVLFVFQIYVKLQESWFQYYKKTGLLRRAKTAAKGPFGLLWWFYSPAFRCCNRSIAAVIKNAAIDHPFSGAFGLLRPYEVPFGLSDPLAASPSCHYRALNFRPLAALLLAAIATLKKKKKPKTKPVTLQTTCNNFSSTKTILQMKLINTTTNVSKLTLH